MNADVLADVLKRRGCTEVCYFHTDHFEPWSTSIDDASARAVERFAQLARGSRHARRLSLFYSVFVPYRLAVDGGVGSADCRVEGDEVVFTARSPRQEDLARAAIAPLIGSNAHEMHLHVHHEYWTRNHSHFDSPVSRWVNAHSTPQADLARLDLHFLKCKEAIAREIGRPFERWGFIHGNWALNASDPLICQINDEIASIMRHGGFGDFSFPAGRSYCDPQLKTPFTCLPLDRARVYDHPDADARPIGAGTDVMRPDRFFIWNSALRSADSSLDYYSAASRKLLSEPERVVAAWLGRSVVLGDRLFIKTHAHSMKVEYRLGEPDSMIPHGYPDVVRAFEHLERACDRAGVALRFVTVDEVMRMLAELDGGSAGLARLDAATATPAPTMAAVATKEAAPPPASVAEIAAELLDMHRAWIAANDETISTDDLFRAKVARSMPLESYEIALADALVERYPPDATRIVEIGAGWGGLAILLARFGYEVLTFEGNIARHAACRWHIEEQIRRHPGLEHRLLMPREGLFPEAFSASALAQDKINVGVATNITSSYTAQHQREFALAATAFDALILDLARFGQNRDERSDRAELLRTLTASDFRPVERLIDQEPYEYWRLASRAAARAARPAHDSDIFPLHGARGPLFSLHGDRRLDACPVCESRDHAMLWRMPETTLPKPIELFDGYFNQVPTLQTPGVVFSFDFCRACESIFLNPVAGAQKAQYRDSAHYVGRMTTKAEWREYEVAYDRFARWIPSTARVMVDAACGLGQNLHIARKRRRHDWQRLIGLELGRRYVEQMRREGLEAHEFDIDNDDLLAIVPAGGVDFVTFCEGFEHVERPLVALRKLLVALRPGGRLFFTAQRYGDDVRAAVRPGEPIYVAARLVDELPRRLGCKVLDVATSATRYYVVLEK